MTLTKRLKPVLATRLRLGAVLHSMYTDVATKGLLLLYSGSGLYIALC